MGLSFPENRGSMRSVGSMTSSTNVTSMIAYGDT